MEGRRGSRGFCGCTASSYGGGGANDSFTMKKVPFCVLGSMGRGQGHLTLSWIGPENCCRLHGWNSSKNLASSSRGFFGDQIMQRSWRRLYDFGCHLSCENGGDGERGCLDISWAGFKRKKRKTLDISKHWIYNLPGI